MGQTPGRGLLNASIRARAVVRSADVDCPIGLSNNMFNQTLKRCRYSYSALNNYELIGIHPAQGLKIDSLSLD